MRERAAALTSTSCTVARERGDMKKSWRSDIDYYIRPNKISCGMGGMWFWDDNPTLLQQLFGYFRLLIGLISASTMFVPEVMMIVVNWGNVTILAGVGCVSTTMGQLLYKMLYLIARRKRARRLYVELRDLWDSSSDPEERRPYEKLAYWARIFTIVFLSSGSCNVFSFSVAGIVDYFKILYNTSYVSKGRHLPFEVWYGTDISATPYFEIAFVSQMITSFICASTVCGMDATFMTIILHTSGQFKLLSIWINKLGKKMNSEPYHLREIEIELVRCIRHHQRIINVVNDVNTILTPIIFVQILTSGLEICLSVFAVTHNGTGADLLKFISYLICMELQLLSWCGPGEILVQESQEVGSSAYFNVPWYDLPPIFQRRFCLIIVRAQQYCSISALTFQTLCIHTLTSVFNTAASFFTLLRQTQ